MNENIIIENFIFIPHFTKGYKIEFRVSIINKNKKIDKKKNIYIKILIIYLF